MTLLSSGIIIQQTSLVNEERGEGNATHTRKPISGWSLSSEFQHTFDLEKTVSNASNNIKEESILFELMLNQIIQVHLKLENF